MNIFSTYKSMEDSAKLCPEGQNIKMLIRHSERHDIKKGASQEEIQNAQLTDNGRKMAICLGESINMEIGNISSSHTQRCIDTCQEIINGYNKNNIEYKQPILKTEMLQSPHLNKNEGSDNEIWENLGIRGIFDCFARNEYMPRFYDLKTSVNRIFNYLFETGNKNNTVDIYCTHDFQLAMILLFINGGSEEYNNILFNGNWPEMLEGMFLWGSRNNFNIIWRGETNKIVEK